MKRYIKAGYLMLILTFSHILVSIIISMLGQLGATTGLIVNSALITVLCMGIPALLFIKNNKSIVKAEKGEFYLKKPKFVQIVLAVVFGIVMFYALAHLNTAFQRLIELTGADLNKSGGLEFPNLQNPTNLIIAIITVAVVPAVFEELFYRSALLYSWRSMKKTTVCLITAALFTLMHTSVLTFPSLFVLGYFLASITYETKSIIPAMIIHFMNNFLSLLYSINPSDYVIENIWEDILGHSIYAFVLLGIAIIVHIIIIKVARKAEKSEQADLSEDSEHSEPLEPLEEPKALDFYDFPHIPVAISVFIYLVLAVTAFGFLYSK